MGMAQRSADDPERLIQVIPHRMGRDIKLVCNLLHGKVLAAPQ